MFIVKVTEETIDQVVAKSKYASDDIPKKAQIGDIILISLSNVDKDVKRIRFVMRYNGFYEDVVGESKKMWEREWRYIINGTDIQPVIPFNMEDILIGQKSYVFNKSNYRYVDSADEESVLKHISIGGNSIKPT